MNSENRWNVNSAYDLSDADNFSLANTNSEVNKCSGVRGLNL